MEPWHASTRCVAPHPNSALPGGGSLAALAEAMGWHTFVLDSGRTLYYREAPKLYGGLLNSPVAEDTSRWMEAQCRGDRDPDSPQSGLLP